MCWAFLQRLVITEKGKCFDFVQNNKYLVKKQRFLTHYQVFTKFRYAFNDMEKQTCSAIFHTLRSSAKVSQKCLLNDFCHFTCRFLPMQLLGDGKVDVITKPQKANQRTRKVLSGIISQLQLNSIAIILWQYTFLDLKDLLCYF